jgi:hypothetical protein
MSLRANRFARASAMAAAMAGLARFSVPIAFAVLAL